MSLIVVSRHFYVVAPILLQVFLTYSASLTEPDCLESYHEDEYEIIPNNGAQITAKNKSVNSEDFVLKNGTLCIVNRSNEVVETSSSECKEREYSESEFEILENGSAIVGSKLYEKGSYDTKEKEDGLQYLMITCKPKKNLSNNISSNNLYESIEVTENHAVSVDCETWELGPDEFEILKNGSVHDYENGILEEGSYKIIKRDGLSYLSVCIPDHSLNSNESQVIDYLKPSDEKTKILIGQIGAGTSLVALTLHLSVYALMRPMRNFPAHNLASLSVALWLGYFFMLFGQIPEILGDYCVASAVLMHYFFLSAFFWMNAISFDIWNSLRLASSKLFSLSTEVKRRLFFGYSLYAWVIPVAVALTALIADKNGTYPHEYKPGFGIDDVCFFTKVKGKAVFFVFPVFGLTLINCLFFALCTIIIIRNTMTFKEHQGTARANFLLYVRLGIVTGLTWLIGVIGFLTEDPVVWYVFTVFNAFQGVFVFVLFSMKRKVWVYFMQKMKSEISSKSYSFKDYSSEEATKK